jgi:hypothetical protein
MRVPDRSPSARARHGARSADAPAARTASHRAPAAAPVRRRRRAAAARPAPRSLRALLAPAVRRWLPVGVVVAVAVVAAGVYVVDRISVPPQPSLLAVVPPAPEVEPVVLAPAGGDAAPVPELTSGPPAEVAEAEPAETAEPEPAPARGPSRRAGDAPAGLPWHSGVVLGSPDEMAAWEDYRGRPVDVVHAFAARGSWEDMVSAGWIMGYYADFDGLLVISQPFWPEDTGGSLGACADGAYDDQWADYGRTLERNGQGDAYTRLAWEFNGDWFEWSATDVDAWKSCYRQVVQAVRSTAPDARFEWNINAHGSQTCDGDAWKCYPGDEYVDVIGIDPYDHHPASPTAGEFAEQCNDDHGLCTVIDFAREHGKEVGVTEWGVINSGIGDNPVYMEQMFETFSAAADVMAYETYFNAAEYGTTLDGDENPESSAVYRELWGR